MFSHKPVQEKYTSMSTDECEGTKEGPSVVHGWGAFERGVHCDPS